MSRSGAALLVIMALNGCASMPDTHCSAAVAREPRAELACRAASGDKQAQLELGDAYADGRGVPRDAGRAAKLWRQAGTAASGVTYVYSPAVGKEAYGRSIPVMSGIPRAASAEAQYRLGNAYLSGQGVARSRSSARKWLERAAAAGYSPAKDLLALIAGQPDR